MQEEESLESGESELMFRATAVPQFRSPQHAEEAIESTIFFVNNNCNIKFFTVLSLICNRIR